MKKTQGLTIIQIMVILLIAGIVALYVVKAIKEKRCEDDPLKAMCAKR